MQDPIQGPQSTSREASVEQATVVQPVCNEGMHKGGSCRLSKRTSDSAELTQLIEAVATEEVNMSGKSYLTVQGDAQIAHGKRECKKGESIRESSHVQPSQLLTGPQPEELSFCRVKSKPIRRHPGLKGSHDRAHDSCGRNSVRGRAIQVGLNIVCI